MRVLTNRLSRALRLAAASSSSSAACASTKISRALSTCSQSKQRLPSPYRQYPDSLFPSPWFATQNRGVKTRGADLKPGNVIEKKVSLRRIYQVVKAQHSTQGRGGAIIQVEIRDVDSGSKSNERFRTDETVETESLPETTCLPHEGRDKDDRTHVVRTNWFLLAYQEVKSLKDWDQSCKSEKLPYNIIHRRRQLELHEPTFLIGVFVAEKSFTYLYTDDETGNIVLMEPETYEQLDVPKHLFGECYAYLQDDMKVNVLLYDERAMSASIPTRVTCTVAESEIPMRASATPQYKNVLLDNGLTVQVPKHILEGDKIIVNTTNHSYVSRA